MSDTPMTPLHMQVGGKGNWWDQVTKPQWWEWAEVDVTEWAAYSTQHPLFILCPSLPPFSLLFPPPPCPSALHSSPGSSKNENLRSQLMKGMLHKMAAKASWEKLRSTFIAWKKVCTHSLWPLTHISFEHACIGSWPSFGWWPHLLYLNSFTSS